MPNMRQPRSLKMSSVASAGRARRRKTKAKMKAAPWPSESAVGAAGGVGAHAVLTCERGDLPRQVDIAPAQAVGVVCDRDEPHGHAVVAEVDVGAVGVEDGQPADGVHEPGSGVERSGAEVRAVGEQPALHHRLVGVVRLGQRGVVRGVQAGGEPVHRLA